MKRAQIFESTAIFILMIVMLVVVIYFFISKGATAPTKGALSEVACTTSAYGRGLFIHSISGFISTISTTYASVYSISSGIVGLAGGAVLQLLTFGLVPAPAVGAGMAVSAYYEGISQADALTLDILSRIPMACPSITENVGFQDKPVTKEELASKLIQRIVDTYRTFGEGKYDPLVGQDPPNPRSFYILETYVDSETNLGELYDMMRTSLEDKWQFSSGEDALIYAYCPEGKGNNPVSFAECKFTKARIYIMFKDSHDYDMYTAGSAACSGNVNDDAKAYKEEFAKGLGTSIESIGASEGLWTDARKDLSGLSPWRNTHDTIVLCIDTKL